MEKSVIAEGKTSNEAIENGLKALKCSKEDVEVKILESEDKRSFFSILEPRVVKVQLTVKEYNKKNNIKEHKEYIVTEKDINEARLGNQCLRAPFKKNEKYNEFWNDYFQKGYDYVSEKYFTPSKQPIKRKISRLFNDNAYIFPKKLRYKLIEIRTKSK